MAAIDQDFIDEYANLLIKQYYYMPKASADIEAMASTLSEVYTFYKQIEQAYDIDTATGAQLDTIGRVVGLNRVVSFAILKNFFGFTINTDALGFVNLVNDAWGGAPFYSLFDDLYESYEMDDETYRFFLKARISVNNVSAYIVSDDKVSLQDSINTLFSGYAYVVDNYDMTLSLFVSPTISNERLRIILLLDLLPRPQGVRYAEIVRFSTVGTFGFSNNPNALGFSNLSDSSWVGGLMAYREFISV